MGLGPLVCVECKVVYEQHRYVDEDGYKCVSWSCPICYKTDSRDFALTISKELHEEIFPKK